MSTFKPNGLSGGAIDTLWCLFRNGPTWDGDLPSKVGRDEIVGLGLAERGRGFQWITQDGMDVALDREWDRKREAERRR